MDAHLVETRPSRVQKVLYQVPWDVALWPPGPEREASGKSWREMVEAALGVVYEDSDETLIAEVESWLRWLELPLPTAGEVDFGASPERIHPLSGAKIAVEFPPDLVGRERKIAIRKACEMVLNAKPRWEDVPARLRETESYLPHLPADPSTPYYTVWQRQTIAASIAGALPAPAFLSVRIGSVQEFIDRARTTEDYWAGSYLVARLTQAMHDVIRTEAGQDSILFPRLPSGTAETWASHPNGILAIVRADQGKRLAEAAIERARKDWDEWVGLVRNEVEKHLRLDCGEEWQRIWLRQTNLEAVFEFFWTVTPWRRETAYRELYAEASAALESCKLLRSFAQQEEPWIKCQQCGWREALQNHQGYNRAKSGQLWRQMATRGPLRYRFRENERLCAVCVTRRLAGRVALGASLDEDSDRRFPSTSSIAVAPFLRRLMPAAEASPELQEPLTVFRGALDQLGRTLRVGRLKQEYPESILPATDILSQFDGRWWYLESYRWEQLSKEYEVPRENAQRAGEQCTAAGKALDDLRRAWKKAGLADPAKYVALVMVDGDEVGGWIRGDQLPTWRDSIHSALQDRFSDKQERQREPGIITHLALSEALGELSGPLARRIEQQSGGAVIYSGGDDLLAIVPVAGLAGLLDDCAGLASSETGAGLLPGGRFSVSAAALVMPHDDGLSGGIREVGRLLREVAKESCGRQAGVITTRRQSGQQTRAYGRWRGHAQPFRALDSLVGAMGQDADMSARFIQHAAHLEPALREFKDREGLVTMALHLLGRAENVPDGLREAIEQLMDGFYFDWVGKDSQDWDPWSRFVEWLVTARFLARMQ